MSEQPERIPDRDELDTEFAVIGSYRTHKAAHDAGLSVLAGGQAYWVRKEGDRFLLIVPRSEAQRLLREVRLSERLNRFWPPRRLVLADRSVSKLPCIAALGCLVTLFALQNQFPWLQEQGANASRALQEGGQWWRVFTAMTLHADLGHLAGNLMGLSLFSYLCARYLGNGLAWLLIVLAAAASNATNGLLASSLDYRSLGASTAVFAALGLLSGFPVGSFLRSRNPIRSRDWLVPFFGGCTLFAWMGGGEFPTDVPAHLWAFLFGSLGSMAAAGFDWQNKLGPRWQTALLATALILVGSSWCLAFASR
ncbi:rhomboid family intramembrane serine protease [Pelagicoccus sp. SDUM812003]|uniref:rhomboid family intramembrane serine protease n=1 Tax=Pelagicoccus sp. SDUM812003 TaxID=3041267 RepID=UPI00280CBB0B|nr:rhomboid family intramembrane serine protease [Pelagicoccus sp. SDUM812003]MDQ8202360.1 rhomboid family intramembrane serine protease [Pelagicoccus sp. SDUM812003]